MGKVRVGSLEFSSINAAHLYAMGAINMGQSLIEALHQVHEAWDAGNDVAVEFNQIQIADGLFVDALTPEKIETAWAELAARQEAQAAAQRAAMVESAYAAQVDVLNVLLAAGVIDAKKHEEMAEELRPKKEAEELVAEVETIKE